MDQAILLLAADGMTPHDITIFFLSLGLLLGLARLLGEIARKYNQPAVLGELLAGVLLGPTVFDYVSPDFYLWLFPAEGSATIALTGFVQIAVAFLLLVAGLEVDLSSVWRQGKAAMAVSTTGMVFPFAIGFGLAYLLPGLMGKEPNGDLLPFAAFMGIAMSITALPVIAKILMDLNLFKSDMGMLVMSAAMVNDLIGWLGFAFVLAMLSGNGSGSVVPTLAMTIAFAGGMLTLGRWLAHRSLPFIQAHTVWPGGVIGFVLTVALLGGAVTEWIGIHAIFGAFLAGIAVGDSAHLRERTRDTIHQFIMNIFAPVFFATLALRTNFIEAFDPLLVVTVLVVAIIGKLFGCYLGAIWAGMSKRESWATGFGMTARGAMEMVLAQLAREAGLITDELFVAIVIMALVTSMISGPMMQKILRQKQQRQLIDFLAERNIVTKPQFSTIDALLRELCTRAAEIANLRAEKVYEAVIQRERIMHTGLPGGLAVPHARLQGLAKPCVVLCRHPDGVDFDSPDGQLARIICLMLTPTDQPDTQIELLDLVVRTFQDPEIKQLTLDAATPTELLAILNQAKSQVGNGIGHHPQPANS